MIYRVILHLSCWAYHFDFDSIQAAGDFAEIVLTHFTMGADGKKKPLITIEMVDPEEEDEE